MGLGFVEQVGVPSGSMTSRRIFSGWRSGPPGILRMHFFASKNNSYVLTCRMGPVISRLCVDRLVSSDWWELEGCSIAPLLRNLQVMWVGSWAPRDGLEKSDKSWLVEI